MNPQHRPAVRGENVRVTPGLGLLQIAEGELGAWHRDVRGDRTGQLQEGPVLVPSLVVLAGRVQVPGTPPEGSLQPAAAGQFGTKHRGGGVGDAIQIGLHREIAPLRGSTDQCPQRIAESGDAGR